MHPEITGHSWPRVFYKAAYTQHLCFSLVSTQGTTSCLPLFPWSLILPQPSKTVRHVTFLDVLTTFRTFYHIILHSLSFLWKSFLPWLLVYPSHPNFFLSLGHSLLVVFMALSLKAVIKTANSHIRSLDFESQLYHSPAPWPWASYLSEILFSPL